MSRLPRSLQRFAPRDIQRGFAAFVLALAGAACTPSESGIRRAAPEPDASGVGSGGATGEGSGGAAGEGSGGAAREGSGGSAGSSSSRNDAGNTASALAPVDGAVTPIVAMPDSSYAAVIPGEGLPAFEAVPTAGKLQSAKGIVWWKSKRALLIADEAAGAIVAFTPPDDVQVWLTMPDAKPYGLAFGEAGSLWVTSRAARRVVRVDVITKAITTVVDGVTGMLGDVVAATTGDAYFTTTGESSAVHRIARAGTHTVLATYAWGAGLFLSLDQKFLEGPGDFAGHAIFRLPLAADGGAAGAIAVWTHPGREGGEGLCMDVAGNLYVPTRGGLEAIGPDGTRLRPNLFDGQGNATNCAFGGADGKTLYLSIDGKLLRLAVKIPGLPE